MSAIKIASKFKGRCKTCEGPVRVGESVLWTPGTKGVSHVECPDASLDTLPITVPKIVELDKPDEVEQFPMLFNHQKEIVNTAKANPKSKLYLAFSPGLGKTLTSIASVDVANAYPLIIVCPPVVKINWQREVKQWIGKDAQILSSKTPYPITSDVVIINYDVLGDWSESLINLNAKSIVFDECHYIKNIDSKRTMTALEISKTIDGMKLMLSGTPTPNSAHDLVVPLDILGVLKHFGGRKKFANRYCPPVRTTYGTISYKRARNLDELHKNLIKLGFVRRRREDCLDLPEKIRVDIPVTVNVKDDMEFYGPLIEQMESGTLKEAKRVVASIDRVELKGHMMKERMDVGIAKIDDVAELAAGIDEPLVIMVHHREVVSQLMKKLKKRNPVKLMGGMTPKARQESVDAFQNGDTDLMIASISAAGVGINLFRGTSMIMGELPFTAAAVDQAESRCHRQGAENDLTVYRVVGIGTFDDIVTNIIARKEAVSASVEDGIEVEVVRADDILAHKILKLYLTHE